MAVNSVQQNILENYGMQTSSISKSTKSGSDMNMDAFLNLLVTQMQYQDPLEPAKNEDFLAQLAQYSSLEQMQNINRSSQMSQANQLIGKVVEGNVTNPLTKTIDQVQGVVDSVAYRDGKIFLVVGEKEMTLEDVLNVTYLDYNSKSVDTMDDIKKTLESMNEKLEKLSNEEENDETEAV